MSGNLALARPLRAPRFDERDRREPGHDEQSIRHLEVAASRAQRRARPKLVYAIFVVGGIGAILLAQLLLSILVADGAYTISGLQRDQRDLSREERDLDEQLEVLSSTQNLTANAEALGMVASGNPVFLDVSTGAVSGTASAAGGSLANGGNMIGNSLLTGSSVIDPQALADAQAAADAAAASGLVTEDPEGGSPIEAAGGAPSAGTGTPSGTLPSPTTR